MEGPVMDHPNSRLFQSLRQVIPYGNHVVSLIQGPVGGGFGVSFPLGLGVAFGAMGVQNQHRRFLRGEVPHKGPSHQLLQVHFFGTEVFDADGRNILRGECRKGRFFGHFKNWCRRF